MCGCVVVDDVESNCDGSACLCKCSKVLKWQQQQVQKQQIGDSVIIADSYDKLITIKALQMWT